MNLDPLQPHATKPIAESDGPEAIYQQRVAAHQQTLRESKRRLATIRSSRRYLLYGLVACGGLGSLFPGIAAAAFIICIVVLAVQYRTELALTEVSAEAHDRVMINRAGLARRTRDWDNLTEIPVDESAANRPISLDLDLHGHASVMQLLCTAETEGGISLLVRWLIEPAEPQEVRRRQNVCKSLSPNLDWRQELQRRCIAIGDNADRNCRFQDWAKGSTSLELPAWVQQYARLLRFFLPVVLATFFIHPATATVLFAALLVSNLAITIAFSGGVHSFFGKLAGAPHQHLSGTFSHLRDSTELRETMPQAVSTCEQSVVELERLERVLRLESISRSRLLVWYVYFPLQFLLLWDLQMFALAERWRSEYGDHVESWFDVLAEIEALCSLASLSYENPGWKFPDVIDDAVPTFVAQDLGHPLIPDDCRVSNDVKIGPPGTSLLITGSNMGGKSTLLRAIGINAVLAQTGAPCCCQSLTMSRLNVMTSMRVSDSLSDWTSMFMAQLLNLKRIVDQIRSSGDDELPVMYLFDEILNGTNTGDRRLAVESLLGYLLQCRTIGAMTTHDLEIAKESKHRESFDTHYLGHQLVGEETSPEIRYDYQLRPGIAPTSNAMLLLRLLGLPEN